MFKVNNRNTGTRCEIYSKLTIKTPEVFWTYLTSCSSVSIAYFKQVNAWWVTKEIIGGQRNVTISILKVHPGER